LRSCWRTGGRRCSANSVSAADVVTSPSASFAPFATGASIRSGADCARPDAGRTWSHDFRWNGLPGLTGLAQIVGANAARQARFLDRRCVEDRTMLLDLRLVALAFARQCRPRGACEDCCCGVRSKRGPLSGLIACRQARHSRGIVDTVLPETAPGSILFGLVIAALSCLGVAHAKDNQADECRHGPRMCAASRWRRRAQQLQRAERAVPEVHRIAGNATPALPGASRQMRRAGAAISQ
jgi:hypothetical protein